jgi:hypothetical protein
MLVINEQEATNETSTYNPRKSKERISIYCSSGPTPGRKKTKGLKAAHPGITLMQTVVIYLKLCKNIL